MEEYSFTKIWSAASFFAVLLAILSNLGYWQSFDIDIFSFISLSQLLMMSITKLVWVAGTCLAGFWLGLIAVPFVKAKVKEIKEKVVWFKKFSEYFSKSLPYFAAIVGIGYVIVTVYLIIKEYPFYWILFAPLIVAVVFIPLAGKKCVRKLIPHSATRYAVIAFVGVSSIYSYAKGSLDAYQIKTGSSFQTVSMDPCADRYLGIAGDYVFFYEPTDKTVDYQLAASIETIRLLPMENANCSI